MGKEIVATLMQKEILATFRAATAKPEYLTLDSLEAGLGGWGAFYLAIWAAANVIAKEIQKGKRLTLEVKNEAYTDLDEIAKKAIKKMMDYGADPSNAALCTAMLLYWVGADVASGIPAPNRKLGAVTRLAAGVPSGRVSSLPTEKQNNKISGFAATLAIYQAMEKEPLAPFDASLLPLGVGGGPILGHSAIGEDHLFPKLGKKLGTIGTQGMMKAYLSVGMKPNQWLSALFGTAATLEILHPDSYVGEEFGTYLKTRTPEVVGEAAVEAAQLPKTIHIRGTKEELKTAKVVGDIAIILKDSGTPTVVGMRMFCEICSIIQESLMIGSGSGGGPLLLPLSHWVTSPTLALHLLGKGASQEEIISTIQTTLNPYFQKEQAIVATNVLARKAEGLESGPLTKAILMATEPGQTNAIAKRAIYAYEQMQNGKSLTELVKDVQTKHIESICNAVAMTMSQKMDKKIEYIKLKNVKAGSGRRSHPFAHRHFGFDAYVDVEVKIDGKVYELENVVGKAAPEALLKGDKETLNVISTVTLAIMELLTIGACSMDVVICACMAATRGMNPEEAVKKATEAGNVYIAIPPTDGLLQSVQMASDIMRGLDF